jgi:hypothetical protein
MIVLVAFVSCQQGPSNQKFEQFASTQDSLFVRAYEKRDIGTYQTLLNEYLTKYNSLSASDQKKYAGSLSNAYYNLCCTYSIVGDKANALTSLKKSIDAGYFDYAHIQVDKDLDSLRNDADLQNMTGPLRNIGDFLYILKKAGAYNPEDKRIVPEFTYQSADNPNLTALRKAFNLDSVAGTGNDVAKIKNLLHWIHTLIPHDGNHGNPEVKNAMSMIQQCKRDNRGLNCRGLATVLNECYLSLGIKSRFVTCLPKDSLKRDNDCHVINMVYCESFKKWIWIDPTNEAYVTNEKGELLSVEEVRERMIKELPLVVNPDANWNMKSPVVISGYLFRYMAKNLYMLECPVNSQYDTETNSPGKVVSYIRLLPLDYFDQKPDKKESNGYIFYKTNNPKTFWQTPNS